MRRYAEELRRAHGVDRPDPGRPQLRRGGGARDRRATSTWTTRPSARRRTWRRAWSSSPRRAPSLLTADTLAPGGGLRRGQAARRRCRSRGWRTPVEVYELTRGRAPCARGSARGGRARADALRGAGRGAGAAPRGARPGGERARPGGGDRRRARASGSRGSSGRSPTPTGPTAGSSSRPAPSRTARPRRTSR